MDPAFKEKVVDGKKIPFIIQKLKEGGILGIPTDTVYGIACRMKDMKAVERIYSIKNRPRNKPMVIFVSDAHKAEDFVEEVAPFAMDLMDEFWPGPLTLVFTANERVPKEVTANLDTVGIRVPDQKDVLELLKALGEPLVVTSANISGKPEITDVETLFQELGDELDVILDGGSTIGHGVSTIIDVSGDKPKIIRNGVIKRSRIEEITELELPW
jgi:L-threonylcarbamoyladenylate synthase